MDARFFSLNQKQHLITLLQIHFPVTHQKIEHSCWLYPFSNELGYADIIKELHGTRSQTTDKIKVAILFGESNFISMLPELISHTDIIILADIEPRIHLHNQYLVDCLLNSDSIHDYSNKYIQGKNPLIGHPLYQYGKDHKATSQSLHTLLTKESPSLKSLADFHFLHSEKRFQQCKNSCKNISFVHINLDLTIEKKCEELAHLLHWNNASITLCNFTNIHDYPAYALSAFTFSPEPSTNYLFKSTAALLQHSPNSFVMYALSEHAKKPDDIVNGKQIHYVGNLKTNLSIGLDNYHTNALRQKMRENLTAI